jgi:mRNA-degrading endonuclease RelE of RelBE toxin-antitoxin system
VKTAWTWSPQARAQLRSIDPENAMRILRALTRLAETGAGNARALQGPLAGVTRLRVGPWRVRYRYIEPGLALVLAVEKRGDAYRN